MIRAFLPFLLACGGNAVIGAPAPSYEVQSTADIWSSGIAGASCRPGDLLRSGGCSLSGVGRDAWLTQDVPTISGVIEGWTCGAWTSSEPSTTDTGPHVLTAVVECGAP